ncbi:hypothetical protein Ahy_A04g019637 [Arachis hypogaea]|uniref:Uncharacterized protein n=1 Tax=Arachis hypogaea TaxID=3818 RepID=A0A445DGD8_ARAHY|nr:hypothetical protein Ahy_A04g019637 [Arachis hypogaea]
MSQSPPSAATAETTTVTTHLRCRQPTTDPSFFLSSPLPSLRRVFHLSATTLLPLLALETAVPPLFRRFAFQVVRIDMTTGRGAMDQATGRGCGKDMVEGRFLLIDQSFIMVPNPNYVPPSTAAMPPPTTQQLASTTTPPPATDAATPEFKHRSEATDTPPPPLIIWFIWLTGIFGCLLYFIWDTEYNLTIRKIFDHRMGRQLQQMLEDVCEGREQPDDLALTRNKEGSIDEAFKHWCLTNRANRASTRSSNYIGGSATFMKTNARMSKSLDREAILVEIFKYTHTLKENKAKFANQRSQDHYESYTQRLEAETQQS